MSLTHLQLLSVPVADQDRARDFYVNTLVFDLIADTQMGPDQRWVQVGAPGAQTSLTLVTWFETMPAGSLRGLVIESDDLEADIKALAARGLMVSDVQAAPWGQFVTCEDPDGNGLILQATARASA
jgi:catechol 2,3-dioxygenase-like lactoylglutathione lyase family enzyme